MDDLAEKRVYADRAGATQLVVAAAPGIVTVAVSDGRVGEFGVARRCAPVDVAVDPDAGLAVATEEDVLLAADGEVGGLEPGGFGAAVAVTHHEGRPVAGGPDGRLGLYDGDDWRPLGAVPSRPLALEGPLAATEGGVFRLVDGALQPAGLAEVRDVAEAAGIPLAATADGLYVLANGWIDAIEGDFQLVAGSPDGRAHATSTGACYERVGGDWAAVTLPGDGSVVAVAYGERPYALTDAGDLLIEGADGWQASPLGLEAVRAAAVCGGGPNRKRV